YSSISTSRDLVYAAVWLTKLSRDKEPLVWAKRLADRFVKTRHPKTGISYWCYTHWDKSEHDSHDSILRKLVPVIGEYPISEFPWFVHTNRIAHECTLGYFTPTPGVSVHWQLFEWQSQLLCGDLLGEEGRELSQWSLEELNAFGRASYRKKDNAYVPILTDGTSLEGYEVKEYGPLGPRGVTLQPLPAGPSDLWAYAMAYRVGKNVFMWDMAHSMAVGNGFGDIGENVKNEPKLNNQNPCSDPYALLAFVELYKATSRHEFLQMGKKIGNNILSSRFHKGFFVASKQHTYTKFDAIDALALLHLHSELTGGISAIPQVWPNKPFFEMEYRKKDISVDNQLFYTLTDSNEPPTSLQEAAVVGDIDLVRSIIEQGTEVDTREDSFYKTALHRAAIAGHNDVAELLIAKGARVDAGNGFPGGTPLDYAAENGHRDVAALLIAHGANVNVRRVYPAGDTPLHSAVRAGHKAIADLLIAKGADVNAKNETGQTPMDVAERGGHREITELLQAKGAKVSIHTAARQGDIGKVKVLLGDNIDVNLKDDQGMTPLHLAAREGHRKIVELLLSNDANANMQTKAGDTPLHYATWPGGVGVEIIRLLIAKGADVNVKNNDGRSPLDMAVTRNRPTIAELLIEKGATVSTIHTAAFVGNVEKIRSFMKGNIDINTKDDDGQTPLFKAVYGGHINAVRFLVDNGANVNEKDNRNNISLHNAVWFQNNEIAKLLIDRGADVQAIGNFGFTPLHWAGMVSNKEMAELLLAKGVDVDAKAEDGRTHLDFAVIRGSPAMGQLFVERGADVSSIHAAALIGDMAKVRFFLNKGVDVYEKKGPGVTALHSAAAGGHKKIAELLIDNGSDVDAQMRGGLTPLHMAAEAGHLDVAELLLSRGADINVKDKRGLTPLDLAQKAEHEKMVDLLLKQMLVHNVAVTKISAAPSCVQGETVSIVVTLDNRGDCVESRAVKLVDATDDREIARQSATIHSKHWASSEADLTFDGETRSSNRFANYLAVGGDVNGDGYQDILVGSAFYPNGDSKGRTYLYYGGTNMDAVADKIFTGENTGDNFGDGIHEMADMNHDGFDDLLIGATKFNGAGRLYVFYGGSDMDDTPDIVIDSPDGSGCYFGYRPAAGDINNDGFLDLAVCAPRYNSDTGRVYLYYGP
ncbi:MAG: hypothetical protein E4G89_02150, partial [Methanothrix sp.]